MASDSEVKSRERSAAVLIRILCCPFPGPRTAVLALVLSSIELLFLAFNGNSFWANRGIGTVAQLSLAGLVMLWWTAVVWCGFWLLRGISAISRSTQVSRRKSLFQCSMLAIVAVAVNLYLLCWFFYWRLGVFPDGEALYFGGLNGPMLVKYFWQTEQTFWLSSLAVFAIAFVACIVVCRAVLKRDELFRTPEAALLRQAVLLFVVANAAILVGSSSQRASNADPATAESVVAVRHPWAPYSFELSYHANPAVTLLATVVAGHEPLGEGEIPLEELRPVGPVRTLDFPDIPPAKRRNIILITIESLRSDAILMTHQGREVMPNVATLARAGHFFPSSYANSTHSDYSDPCIVSSLYPLRSTQHHFYRREDPWPKVLIYDLLKQYGYATAIFSSQNEAWSNMHLFYESAHLDVLFDSRSDADGTFAVSSVRDWMEKTGQLAGKLDDAVTIVHACNWLQQQSAAGTPFFLSMNLQTSHFPYVRPDGSDGPFQPGKVSADTSILSFYESDLVTLRNAYFNSLDYVDLQIAKLIDLLNKAGLRESTIIAVTGDHGEAFMESGVAAHAGLPVESVVKTGLVLNCPGLWTSTTDDYLAESVDIVPTLLGSLGLPTHPAHQGMDLLSPSRPPREERLVFIHCVTPLVDADAVVSGAGWKYIFNRRRNEGELYDRPSDQVHQVSMLEGHPQIGAELNRLLSDWRSRQLRYYSSAKYYHWFYPPRAPGISRKATKLLRAREKHATDRDAAKTNRDEAGS